MKSILKIINNSIIHRLFYPIVPIILTIKSKNIISGLVVNSCMPLSFNPPLIGVSINKNSFTNELMQEIKYFALNWINKKHVKKLKFIGTKSGRLSNNKLKDSGFNNMTRDEVEIIMESEAIIKCQIIRKHSVGDHDLFIGKVIKAYASQDFKNYWLFKRYEPILYNGLTEDKEVKLYNSEKSE